MANNAGGTSKLKIVAVTLLTTIFAFVVAFVVVEKAAVKVISKLPAVQLGADIAEALTHQIIDGTALANPCGLVDTPVTESPAPTDDTADIFKAVSEQAGTNREAIVALGASYLETTWDPTAGSSAVGPWQIQHPGVGGVHPDITVGQARTPSYALWYMFNKITPNFRDGIRNVDPPLWTSNPTLAMETAIFNTEQPRYWYHQSQGQARVDEAYKLSLGKLTGLGFSGNLSKESRKGSNVIGPQAPVIANPVASTKQQQIEQHLFIGVSNTQQLSQLVTSHPYVGGVFLEAGSNGRVDPDLLKALPGLLAKFKLPPLVATDQEYTSFVNSLGLVKAGTKASDLAGMSLDAVKAEGARIGKAMAALGINMDFAPVVDRQVDDNAAIGKFFRGISTDTDTITRVAAAFMDGLNSANVTPVIKHFPDDGVTNGDPHAMLPTTPSIQELEKSGVKSFKGLASKKTAIMVGHLAVPGLTDIKHGIPASESVAAYLYLRDPHKTAFNGLAITDELGGMVGAGTQDVPGRVVLALNAGADMALVNIEHIDDLDAFFTELDSNVAHSDNTRIIGQKQLFGLTTIRDAALKNCQLTTANEILQAQIGINVSAERNKVINQASKWVGKIQYSWGGGGIDGPTTGICGPDGAQNDCNVIGFDCSGLMRNAYAQIGVNLGQVANDQFNNTSKFADLNHDGKNNADDLKSALPGDLLFFRGSGGNAINHVGMYLGNNKFVNAPQSGQQVSIGELSARRMSDFVAVTDPIAAKAAGLLQSIPIPPAN